MAGWGFVALLALLMVGPALLIYEFGVNWSLFADLPWLPSPKALGWNFGVLAWASFVALLLTGVFGVFASKSARPAR